MNHTSNAQGAIGGLSGQGWGEMGRAVKQQVKTLLTQDDLAEIVRLAVAQRRVLSYLTALTYDSDPVVAQRAVLALGLAAGAVSDIAPEFVRGHLRRLFWLLNDESGGIGWYAAEAIGEIIRARPARFAEFIPNLVWLLDMAAEDATRFRPSILRGITRVAEVTDLSARADLIGFLNALLGDPDPALRDLARDCLSAGRAAPRRRRACRACLPIAPDEPQAQQDQCSHGGRGAQPDRPGFADAPHQEPSRDPQCGPPAGQHPAGLQRVGSREAQERQQRAGDGLPHLRAQKDEIGPGRDKERDTGGHRHDRQQ